MELSGKKILIFVHEMYEDLELQYPKYRLIEAGAKVVIAGPEAGKTYTGKRTYPCKADISIKDAKETDYQCLIIPGGYAPDKLRTDPAVLELTKQFHKKGKLIAYICHAGWVPISAGIMKGVKCTSYGSIKDDLVNAGAKWVDEAVVIDQNIISSRCPDDLPQFCQAIIKFLQNGKNK